MGLLAATVIGALIALGMFGPALTAQVPAPDAVLAILGALLLLGIAELLLFIGIHGGAIALSNEAVAGNTTRLMDGWREGAARWPALTGFELLLTAVMLGLYAVAGIAAFATLGPLVSDSADLPTILSAILCLYGVALFSALLVGAIVAGFEAVGARSAVLSGRGGASAFGDAWRTLRYRFKNLFVMGLAVIGMAWVYGFATSIILTPLSFAFMPELMSFNETTLVADATEALSQVGTLYAVYGLASTVLQIPFLMFTYLVWTSFYRQLVGLDVPEQPAPPQYGYQPAAPQAPPAPAQQAPLGLPEPPPDRR